MHSSSWDRGFGGWELCEGGGTSCHVLGNPSTSQKNRIVRFQFKRSGYTVSRYVQAVLGAVLKLHDTLLVTPEPVSDECDDSRWKWFKVHTLCTAFISDNTSIFQSTNVLMINWFSSLLLQGCLGALDGTYINMHVSNEDKPRYRSRKGQICTNTLAVCDRKMRFVYVLCGWEGSAGDARVLRDAVTREHGLKLPRGNPYGRQCLFVSGCNMFYSSLIFDASDLY